MTFAQYIVIVCANPKPVTLAGPKVRKRNVF